MRPGLHFCHLYLPDVGLGQYNRCTIFSLCQRKSPGKPRLPERSVLVHDSLLYQACHGLYHPGPAQSLWRRITNGADRRHRAIPGHTADAPGTLLIPPAELSPFEGRPGRRRCN